MLDNTVCVSMLKQTSESSFHAMIPSFHAVFSLRQRDKSAKVIGYNDEVIRPREYLLFLGIPSLMVFLLNRKRQCTAGTDAVHCGDGCSALRERLQCTASEIGKTGTEIVSPILVQRKGIVAVRKENDVSASGYLVRTFLPLMTETPL